MSAWPQWTMASIYALSFVSTLYKDGKSGNAAGAIITIMVYACTVAVLYYGGFWTVWGFAP